MADAYPTPHDHFKACERGRCNHDLARAMTQEELAEDGPHLAGQSMQDVLGLTDEEIEDGQEI